MKPLHVCHISVILFGTLALTTRATGQETLPFTRAVDLALIHSSEIAVSHADEVRAYQTYLETRNSYIPKVTIGSDIGYAYGFPLSLEGSAPTLLNVTAQSSVWNVAQQQFVRAAKSDWKASKSQGNDQRAQVIMDTALAYIELNKWESRAPILRAELNVAESVEYAVAERVKEGIDKGIERTKAELVGAQVRLHIAEAEGAIDILRTRLSQLTGVSAQSIRTQRDSVPALTKKDILQNDAVSRAAQSSPAVESAQQSALAKEMRAKGEHRAMYPTADFAAQYGVINSSLTNFEKYFVPNTFQTQNVTFALVLRLPVLDTSQRARAAAADAEALRARKEVEQTKNRAVVDGLRLQHNVEQLVVALDIAGLRYRLAENELGAAHIRMESEMGTQREFQNAAVDSSERALEQINTTFELQRAQLELLRATGALESWAYPGK
jgi:outer membrane protein TolC